MVTIKGITVYLHFTFLIFVAWLFILYVVSGMNGTQLLWSLGFLFSIFISIILHEYGHALVAAQFGINAKKITLYPIGGIASIEKLPENPKQELLISGAGPVVSFCLAALLLLFSPQELSMRSFKEYTGIITKENFLFSLGWLNFALAIFNLIPAFPMDGGRIFRALLAFKYNYIKATAIAASVGRIIAIIFILTGLFSVNFILSLIGVFIIIFAKAEESYLQLKTLVKGIHLSEALMYDYNSLDAQLTVTEAANILENNHNKYFIVMEEGVPTGTLNRIEVIKAVAEQQYEKKIFDLMKKNIVHLEGNMMVNDILEKLSDHEERIHPVFDRDKFIGVVSFQHIIEYLLIHKASSKEYGKTRGLAELV
jgi:Zn-dependent protease